jgi:hypothetical protein
MEPVRPAWSPPTCYPSVEGVSQRVGSVRHERGSTRNLRVCSDGQRGPRDEQARERGRAQPAP